MSWKYTEARISWLWLILEREGNEKKGVYRLQGIVMFHIIRKYLKQMWKKYHHHLNLLGI